MRAEFDKDNNGTISKDEFMEGMRSLADKQMNAAVGTITEEESSPVEFSQQQWAFSVASYGSLQANDLQDVKVSSYTP